MKNEELLEIKQILIEVSGVVGSPKFAYAIAKNTKIIDCEIEVLQKSFSTFTPEENKKYNEFEAKRVAIVKKHSSKGEDETITDHSKLIKDMDKFSKDMQVTLDEYKETIDLLDKNTKFNSEILESDVVDDFKLHLLSINDLPEGLTPIQVERLFPLILEEQEGE